MHMAQYGACKVVVWQEHLFTLNNTYQKIVYSYGIKLKTTSANSVQITHN